MGARPRRSSPERSVLSRVRLWPWLVVPLGIGSIVGIVSPADAANPSCDSGFVAVVVHVTGDSEAFRAKACFRESTDNWEFQDTYVDGWSAVFNYPNNALTAQLRAWDSDGANNGWNKLNMEYPEGRNMTISLCSHDRDAGVSHGCTARSPIVS